MTAGSDRRRRLRDWAVLLPVVGGIAFLMPLAWADAGAGVAVYIFAVWALLIGAARILARRLSGSGRRHG